MNKKIHNIVNIAMELEVDIDATNVSGEVIQLAIESVTEDK